MSDESHAARPSQAPAGARPLVPAHSAPRKTFEQWAEEKKPADWLVAAAAVAHPRGREMTEEEFLSELDAAANVTVR